MKPIRLTALMILLSTVCSAFGQEEYFDDVYSFTGGKKSKAKTETIKKQAAPQEGQVIASYSDADARYDEDEIDAYNRRYVPADSLEKNVQVSRSERRSDTEYTERIVRYHDPSKISVAGADNVNIYLSDGYYSYGYDTQYTGGVTDVNVSIDLNPGWWAPAYSNPWYYTSWYNPWYDPWYWRSPYWYGPSWSFNWGYGWGGWGWNIGWHSGWYDPWYSPGWAWGGGYRPHAYGPRYHYAPQGRNSSADRYYSGSRDRYNVGRNTGRTVRSSSSSVASRLNTNRGGSSVVRSTRPASTGADRVQQGQTSAASRVRSMRSSAGAVTNGSSAAGTVNSNRTRVVSPSGTRSNTNRTYTSPATTNRSTRTTTPTTRPSNSGNTYTAPARTRSTQQRTYTAPSRSGGTTVSPSRSSGGSRSTGGSRSRSGGGGRR